MSEFTGIGASVRRKEDRPFLTGAGTFIDDLEFPGALHCHVLRSPHAHARIKAILTGQAANAPGVCAVFTGAHMAADGIGEMAPLWQITSKDGSPMKEPPRWAIARDQVRHVGEPVAVVIADDLAAAADAAELIQIDYDILSATVMSENALQSGAPQLHEAAPGNVCFEWERGDKEAVDAAIAVADRVIKLDLTNNRLVGAAVETRGVVGCWDAAAASIILYSTTQTPHHIRKVVARQLGLSENKIRVVSPDMGGGFGNKGKHYPEETIMAWAAAKLGRTVKWIARRDESFVSDTQGRDHQTHAELAIDRHGTFLGLRVQTLANIGAYISTFGANIPSAIYTALLSGVYKTPAIHVQVTGVFTNTVPTDAYRGAGRPEACYLLERLADQAARETGMGRLGIRKRNMIAAADMPFTTAIGPTYDCGDFPKILDRACEIAGYAGFEGRRADALKNGRYRGLGIASFVESSGIAPSRMAAAMGARVGYFEAAQIRVDADGGLRAMLGTHNHGQGHATTFAQILSTRLGVPFARIEIIEGDTGAVPIGTGTFGSRSIAVGGSALNNAADKIIAKGRKIAAHMLEASLGDVEFADGAFAVTGTDKRIAFEDIAAAAYRPADYPLEELEPGLDETAYYDPPNFAFSNGAHIAEVEIDAETGRIELLGYVAVDDIGTVINPMIVEGQLHGGLAQGIGQVLMEHCVYDPGNGQLLTGSFMDYAVPRADTMPQILSELDESQPCTHNPLGAKGCGESGAIGAPAAVASAVLDALSGFGVAEIQMPLTPESIWRAINTAEA
ncbi:MAG: xanthine dehydrogenase family protein molybdopterin-binding subunit [Rhodospirillales bacterium]